jgi:hypothetical protein
LLICQKILIVSRVETLLFWIPKGVAAANAGRAVDVIVRLESDAPFAVLDVWGACATAGGGGATPTELFTVPLSDRSKTALGKRRHEAAEAEAASNSRHPITPGQMLSRQVALPLASTLRVGAAATVDHETPLPAPVQTPPRSPTAISASARTHLVGLRVSLPQTSLSFSSEKCKLTIGVTTAT